MNKLILAAFLGISSFLFGAYVTPHYLKAGQVNGALTEFGSLSPELFNQAAISGNYVVLDVRTQEEFLLGHLQNARQADYLQISQFSNYLDSLDKNSKYLLSLIPRYLSAASNRFRCRSKHLYLKRPSYYQNTRNLH